MKKNQQEELIVIFSQAGFTLDTQTTIVGQAYANEQLKAGYHENPYKALLYFGFADKSDLMSPSLRYLHLIASNFTEKLAKDPDIEITRSATSLTDEEVPSLLQDAPWALGSEFLNASWLKGIWDKLSKVFTQELSAFEGSVAQFLLTLSSHINVAGRVFFHLVENKSGDSEDYPFAFLATYSRKSSKNKAEHVPLRNALLEYRDDQDTLLRLLSTVSRAVDKSDFLSQLVESGELFSPLRFTAEEAYVFLSEIPLYEECGVMCRMPDWWRRKNNSVRVSISIGEKPPSQMGLDALLSFTPSLTIDGVLVSREELESLMAQVRGLSLLKGKWVEVDHDKLQAVLSAYDKAASRAGGITLADALRMQMGLFDRENARDEDLIAVSHGQWLSSITDGLTKQMTRARLSVGDDFKATLRQYQEEGFNWLATMKELGFGALLADDMGLGKTVQVLALLDYLRTVKAHKTLLVIPASLIGNWSGEIERFAPNLKYRVLHAKDRELIIEQADLFITTYGMVSRIEELKEHTWDLLILDEAQEATLCGYRMRYDRNIGLHYIKERDADD